MIDSSTVGLVGTTLGTLLVFTWKFSAMTTTLTALVQQMREGMNDLKERSKALDEIPLLRRDVQQLQEGYKRLNSAFPKVEVELAEHRGRAQSNHDI